MKKLSEKTAKRLDIVAAVVLGIAILVSLSLFLATPELTGSQRVRDYWPLYAVEVCLWLFVVWPKRVWP